MTRIALLVPTRGRPKQLHRMMRSVLDTSEKDRARVYLGLSDDDEKYPIFATGGIYGAGKTYPANFPTVQKWNDLAGLALGDADNKLFMLAADDIEFSTQGWDVKIIEHYEGLKNKVHVWALQDSRDQLGTPHPVFSREWIETMGWMLPPYFMHFYPDTWSVEIAKANNCFTHFRDFTLRHNKPSDEGKPDATHSRIRQMGWNIRDRYVSETCGYVLELEKQRLAKAMQ